MTFICACLALLPFGGSPQDEIQVEVGLIRDALSVNSNSKVAAQFAVPSYADYLFAMAGAGGGLNTLKVNVIPCPPGWEKTGKYWVVFHHWLEIELHHDPIYPLIQTGDGLKLGKEIPEYDPGDMHIDKSYAAVNVREADHSADVTARLVMKGAGGRAPIFRMNDIYRLTAGSIDGKPLHVVVAGDALPTVTDGDIVWAGGLLIPWTKSSFGALTVKYDGTVEQPNDDSIAPGHCYLTSWWLPTLAQLPHLSSVRITAPKDWVVRSEGIAVPLDDKSGSPVVAASADRQQVEYSCDFPISFPKVVAGKYTLAGETMANGTAIREYQVDPVDKDRGEKDVQRMAAALTVYEKYLGPFPFPSYECFDSATYYGIESYSYTLLQRNITSWACSHEMGHTYFGGLVPCAYVKDTWNEGLTQYIDSEVFGKNADRSMENGLRTMNVSIPLSKMNVCWDNGSASYYRGVYVMKMLEAEIGFPTVMAALHDIVADRRGKDTTWDDLRPYFEKKSGKQLDWYWSQWIDSATYPTLEMTEADTEVHGTGYLTRVTVRQTGTEAPMRLRYVVRVSHGDQVATKVETTHAGEETFDIETNFKPTQADLDTFGYTMAHGNFSKPVTGG